MIPKIENRPAGVPAGPVEPASPLVPAWEGFMREKQYIKNPSPQDHSRLGFRLAGVVEDCVLGMRAAVCRRSPPIPTFEC